MPCAGMALGQPVQGVPAQVLRAQQGMAAAEGLPYMQQQQPPQPPHLQQRRQQQQQQQGRPPDGPNGSGLGLLPLSPQVRAARLTRHAPAGSGLGLLPLSPQVRAARLTRHAPAGSGLGLLPLSPQVRRTPRQTRPACTVTRAHPGPFYPWAVPCMLRPATSADEGQSLSTRRWWLGVSHIRNTLWALLLPRAVLCHRIAGSDRRKVQVEQQGTQSVGGMHSHTPTWQGLVGSV